MEHHYIVDNMSDLKTEMHQIRYCLGIHPRSLQPDSTLLQTPLVDLTALPRPLGDLRGPTSTGREKIKEREGKGRGEMGVGGRRR